MLAVLPELSPEPLGDVAVEAPLPDVPVAVPPEVADPPEEPPEKAPEEDEPDEPDDAEAPVELAVEPLVVLPDAELAVLVDSDVEVVIGLIVPVTAEVCVSVWTGLVPETSLCGAVPVGEPESSFPQ